MSLPHSIRDYLRANPGSNCKTIAAALETTSARVSRCLRTLREKGEATCAGKTKAARWTAV